MTLFIEMAAVYAVEEDVNQKCMFTFSKRSIQALRWNTEMVICRE